MAGCASARQIVLCLLGVLALGAVATNDLGDPDHNPDPNLPIDDDLGSDLASFVVVLVHSGGFKCQGSLVTLRAVVTTRACARPRGPGLWARAASAPCDGCVRRVRRASWSGDTKHDASAWTDLAYLELEQPFGSDAMARSIEVAKNSDVLNSSVYNMVRIIPGILYGEGDRLRVLEAAAADVLRCADAVPEWSSVAKKRAFCFDGPELCDSEWGAGVVCDGHLCGVVARSGDGERGCGVVTAALSLPEWREFLHCAHTISSCGRAPCEKVCSVTNLWEVDGPSVKPGPSPPPALPLRTTAKHHGNSSPDIRKNLGRKVNEALHQSLQSHKYYTGPPSLRKSSQRSTTLRAWTLEAFRESFVWVQGELKGKRPKTIGTTKIYATKKLSVTQKPKIERRSAAQLSGKASCISNVLLNIVLMCIVFFLY